MSMPKKRTEAGGPLDGSKLLMARREAGLTQEDLARKSGMRVQNIVRLEKDQVSDPALSTIVALTRALGVKVDDLLRSQLDSEQWVLMHDTLRDLGSMCRMWAREPDASEAEKQASQLITELGDFVYSEGVSMNLVEALDRVRAARRMCGDIDGWGRALKALSDIEGSLLALVPSDDPL